MNNELFEAIKNNNIQKLQELLENNVNVNEKNKNGETPLYITAEYGHTEVAKLLIEKGANVNTRDKNYNTLLHIATVKKNIEMVKLLIDKGANINIQNKNSQTPLHLILRNENLRSNDQIRSTLKTKYYKDFEREVKEDITRLITLQEVENIVGFEDFKKNIFFKMNYQNLKDNLTLNLNRIELQANETKIKTIINEAFLMVEQDQKIQIEVSTLQSKTISEITQAEVEKLGARPKGSKIVDKQSEIETGCKPYHEKQTKKDDNFDKDGANDFSQSSANTTSSSINVESSTRKTSQQPQNQDKHQYKGKQNQLYLEQQYQETLKKMEQLEILTHKIEEKKQKNKELSVWERLFNNLCFFVLQRY